MKYIEKDEAYKIVLHYGSYAASAKIADLPSIDLVRCKECKHHELMGGSHVCRQLGLLSVDTDWFCADGERSEE